MEKRLRYSVHAMEEMERDSITRVEVCEVLGSPDEERPSFEGRYKAWRVVEGRGILVVWAFDADYESVWVITVTLQSRRLK